MCSSDLQNRWERICGEKVRSEEAADDYIEAFQASGKNLRDYLKTRELQIIQKTYADCGKDDRKTAEALGISLQLLRYKLGQLPEKN